ncbi:hypothetical protein FB451DRAFT_1558891 [Mycena latifolia]|nr:hypothetical protein FB451DRAFT_1558891 [Mycena latifolia]
MSGLSKSSSFDSPVKHLLHTNLVPTAEEYAWISGHVLEPQRDLALIDEEIRRMQQKLEQLKARRQELAEDIDAHLALLSPARRLPEDILREIFVASLPSTHNAIMASRESPLLLCQVCSGWRNVALTTPQLWSSLHLVIPDESRAENIYSLVERWISRSGILPLSVSIGVSSSLMNSDTTIAAPFIALLVAVSTRWQHIEFTTPPHNNMDYFSQPLSALSPADVPNLTRVKFGIENPTALWSPFLAAPSISHLAITLIPEDVGGFSVISWHSLTRLDLGSTDQDAPWTGRNILEALQRCVNLEGCSLVITQSDPSMISDNIITLPRLTSLSITCYDSTVGGLMAQRMVLPELTSLECIEPFGPGGLHLSFFPAPKLRALTIDGLLGVFGRFIMFVNPFPPSLETLQIRSRHHEFEGFGEIDINDTFLQAFSPAQFPRLHTLKIYGCYEITDAGLLSYITARANSGFPLQCFDFAFSFTRPMEVDILPDLAELVSAGLRISLTYDLRRPEPELPPYRPWEGTDLAD